MQEAYDLFVDRVVEGRSLPRDKVLAAAEGRVWTGSQALDLKLVDKLGTLDAAIERARELSGAKGVPAEMYPAPKSFFEELGERLSSGDSSAFALARRTAIGRRALALGGLLVDNRVLAFAPLSLEVR
jgi:protease IV